MEELARQEALAAAAVNNANTPMTATPHMMMMPTTVVASTPNMISTTYHPHHLHHLHHQHQMQQHTPIIPSTPSSDKNTIVQTPMMAPQSVIIPKSSV